MNFTGKLASKRQSHSISPSPSPRPSPSPGPSPLPGPSSSPEPYLSARLSPSPGSSTTPKKKRPNEYTVGFDKFLEELANCSSKPAILSLISPYSESFVPKSLSSDLPNLAKLYNPDYVKLDYQALLKKASEVTVEVSELQANCVEQETHDQQHSRLWYRMRCGRITASKLRAACCTDPCAPLKSLIMSICYPELSKFKSTFTQWGCDHEKYARDQYRTKYCQDHREFQVRECGFYISTEFQFIGASPDGLVSCKCCGDGVCEIKV